MKKVFSIIASALLLSSLTAQNTANDEARELGTVTKKGQQILPQAGDFAIGIDATPIFKYIGNSFNNNADNRADNLFSNYAIVGKYFLTDRTAIRLDLDLDVYSNTTNNSISQYDYQTVNKRTGLGLNMSYEMRRGYGRLQGFFGPRVGFGVNAYSSEVKYGENYHTNTNLEYSYANFLVGGFAGVEYFVLPKISIGGEAGLNFQYANRSDSEIDGITQEDGFGDYNFSTNYGGRLFFTFHF